MRLINTVTLQLEEYFDKAVPEYAILSHTWGQNEVVLADYEQRIYLKQKRGDTNAVSKIRNFCRLAAVDGYTHIWVDTCCIDKKSSAELSEAINSMYQWYRDSQMCYIYLNDVSKKNTWDATAEEIRSARWFTRGWTLQELLAPRLYRFYDRHWNLLGGRYKPPGLGGLGSSTYVFSTPWHPPRIQELSGLLSSITDISLRILEAKDYPEHRSVAEKMSWASNRVTTRKEDVAYCLLGIFGVNMPLLYGEGNRAFARLQAAIMETTSDHTMFAWDHGIPATHSERSEFGCLAQSPSDFRNGALLVIPAVDDHTTHIAQHHTLTHLGVHITLPVIELSQMGIHPNTGTKWVLAVLACSEDKWDQLPGARDDPRTIALPLCTSFPYTNRFSRVWLQTRPIVVDKKVSESASLQSMYLETAGPSSIRDLENLPDYDQNECKVTVSGFEFAITERFPYYITSRMGKHVATDIPPCSFPISIDLERMEHPGQPDFHAITTIGLKLDRLPSQTTSPVGPDSYFVLVRYATRSAASERIVLINDYALISGNCWPSLTAFMLDDDAAATPFLMYNRSVVLPDIESPKQPKYLTCRRLESDSSYRVYETFKFELQVGYEGARIY